MAITVGEAYASKGIDRQNLVKLYVGIQGLGAVHGKPEDIEDRPRVSQLGQELSCKFPVSRWSGIVLLHEIKDDPAGG